MMLDSSVDSRSKNSPSEAPAEGPAERRRILFLNRSYWPDAEATGQLLTELCEDLASSAEVMVLAGQPNQNPGEEAFQARGWQRRHNVAIRRVWNSRFSKASPLGRLTNFVSFLLAATLAAFRLPRPDVIVVETDPPVLCLLAAVMRRWYKAQLVVYLQDIYPDLAVALGKLRANWVTRWLRRVIFGIYRRADRVVVLSRDMQELLIRSGVSPDRIVCVPNWVDTELVYPEKEDNRFRKEHGLSDRFVVMYSGNMGLCQRLEDVVAAAQQLLSHPEIVFVLVGDGAKKQTLESTVKSLDLSNVVFLPYQPKSRLADSLSAADLHLVPLDPRIASYLMPSKLYGILASGSAVAAIAPAHCELAQIVRDEQVGIVVAPESPQVLAEEILRCAQNRHDLLEMGLRARHLAERLYDRRIATARFAELLASLERQPDELSVSVAGTSAREPSPHVVVAQTVPQSEAHSEPAAVQGR